ncbi:MAG: L-2-amino-thiazoline-4-carboxylic acid hydrolase [Panacagrimonas sp.]|nr:L-2-amino-thiazoline-4-carboxylic acid hydrolase [Panacagrimonas sp.]MCC2656101.1 L-2-amino-thiazoline-4-carboxylic acid hydrolase [Panacagrimonas sp.]
MAISPFEMYKAQADVLVPLVRALLVELGAERTHKLVSEAIGEHFRGLGKSIFETLDGEDFGAKTHSLWKAYNVDNPLDYKIEKQTKDSLYARVDGCRFAEFYRGMNAPELGFLLCCGQDYPLTEGMDPNAVMRRPMTIMQGHDHCEFYWDVHADPAAAQAEKGKEVARVSVEQIRLLMKHAQDRAAAPKPGEAPGR